MKLFALVSLDREYSLHSVSWPERIINHLRKPIFVKTPQQSKTNYHVCAFYECHVGTHFCCCCKIQKGKKRKKKKKKKLFQPTMTG